MAVGDLELRPEVSLYGRWTVEWHAAYAGNDYPTVLALLDERPEGLENGYVQTQRAWALVNLGRYDDALAAVDTVLPPDTGLVGLFRSERFRRSARIHDADLLRLRAEAKYYLQSYDAALKDIGESIRLDGKQSYAHWVRAQVHAALGQHADAEKDLDAALALEKGPGYFEKRAWMRLEQRKFDGAREDADAAAQAGLGAGFAQTLRGWIDINTNEWDSALQHFEAALATDAPPDSAKQGKCEAISRANGFEPHAVVEACTAALATQPECFDGQLNRGDARLKETAQL